MSRSLNRPKTAGCGLPAPLPDQQPPRASTRLPAISGAARLNRGARLWTDAEPGGAARQFIGEGAFGRVFKAVYRGREVAVKEVGDRPNRWRRVNDSPDHDYRRELRGADFLLDLRHENVVRYLQFDTSEAGRLYVVMEMIDGRNLSDLRQRGPFSEDEMRSVIVQTCRGLNYLHSRRPQIVHRDVKGSNIMLTTLHRIVKLVDLGLAILRDPERDQTRRSLAGTHRFMAPEVYEHFAYSAKSDVYALGCTIYELQSGRPPHADKTNEMAICYAVMNLGMPELPARCSSSLGDLYSRCTKKEPAMRPTAGEILEHSFLTGVDA